ncbi:MAG TPA: hypothetical protein VIK30_01350 [Polyangia bacterium]
MTPAAQVPIRIDFEAPAGCADTDAFYDGVLARMSRVRHARPGENAMRLIVRLTRTGGKVHGELHIKGEGGESDTRRVDGATCIEVVQVLALTAALAIDPSAGVAVPAGPEKPLPAPPPSPSRPPAAGAAPAPPAPPAPLPAPPPAPPPRAESPPEPPPPPAPAEPPSVNVTPAEPPIDTRRSPPPSPRASGWELGAALVAAEVVSPLVSAGGAVSLRAGTTIHEGLTPSATLALVFLPGDFLRSGDDIGVRFAALALTGCPGWALGARVEIEPCARATIGLLAATDHSVTNPRSVDLPWWSVGALLRATTRLGASGFTLELAGGVDLPLAKRSFVITQPAYSVGGTPTVSPTLSLGIGHGL